MPRRLPVLPLILAATAGLFALTSVMTAQPPAATSPGDGLKRSQEENLKLYKRFSDELLKLAQKWEKSDSPDERDRAKNLRAALQIADKHGVELLFRDVVNRLAGLKTGPEFDSVLAKDAALVKALRDVLEVLETEDESDRIQKEIRDLKELIAKVNKIKRDEENLLARTNVPKSDQNKLAEDQAKLAKETKELANRMAKNDPKDGKDPKNGNPNANPNEKDTKSEPKGEGKAGESTAEPKPDTKESKSDGKEGKGGDPKDPMSGMGDPKGGGEPKPEPKGGMPPDAGSSKESPTGGDPMSNKGMGDPKPMSGDPKPPMGGDPKAPSPSDSKAQGDGKGDSKPSDGKGGDSKPMSPSGGMPSGSPPSDSKGSPSGSPPSGSPPSGSPSPPNPNNPNDEAKRNLEEAVPPQKGAEDDLKNNKRDEASRKEDQAIKALEKALAELEKRLKQLREKEMLKKLEDLERRVTKMLRMQIEVYEATKAIDGNAKKSNGTLSVADRQRAGIESEKEGEIVAEADKGLRVLEGEGTAVVFAAVLGEVRKDMESVQKQLNAVNVGEDTQLVEEQIIAQLQQMLEALKKAKQDLQNPPPPPPPGSPPPGDPKKDLVKLIEQLKLLKSLQVQVNDRTTAFGKRTPEAQARDTFMQEQLKQLGDRQKVLQDMLHKIAAQMNQQ